jgi:hypothetical protein
MFLYSKRWVLNSGIKVPFDDRYVAVLELDFCRLNLLFRRFSVLPRWLGVNVDADHLLCTQKSSAQPQPSCAAS